MCGAVAPAAPVRYGLRLAATSRVTWPGTVSRLSPLGSGPDFGERNRGQGRLGFPDGVQQRHRIQLDPILTQRCLHLHADRVVLHQPVAGRGWRAVPLDDPGAVPSFLHQLERRLEVVHVLSHRPVQVGHGLSGNLARIAVMTDVVAHHRAVFFAQSRPGRSCGTAGNG